MRGKMPFACFMLLLALAYSISPYVALFRLHEALERGDSAYLEGRVDWKSARDGIKQDIADGVIGPLIRPVASNGLPQFGASFMAGIAANAVDQDINARNVVEVMHQIRSDEPDGAAPIAAGANPFACFDWAFFEGPASFTVTVHPGEDMDGHLRLRLELRGGQWTVVRMWVPQDIVDRATHRV